MGINLGTTNITKVYLGQQEVSKVYQGNNLIYPAGTPTENWVRMPNYTANSVANDYSFAEASLVPDDWIYEVFNSSIKTHGPFEMRQLSDGTVGYVQFRDYTNSRFPAKDYRVIIEHRNVSDFGVYATDIYIALTNLDGSISLQEVARVSNLTPNFGEVQSNTLYFKAPFPFRIIRIYVKNNYGNNWNNGSYINDIAIESKET